MSSSSLPLVSASISILVSITLLYASAPFGYMAKPEGTLRASLTASLVSLLMAPLRAVAWLSVMWPRALMKIRSSFLGLGAVGFLGVVEVGAAGGACCEGVEAADAYVVGAL